MSFNTMEEFAKDVKKEFKDRFEGRNDGAFWEYSQYCIRNNLDMIFENFDNLGEYLEQEEIDYLLNTVTRPDAIYSERVSKFMKEKYEEVANDVKENGEIYVFDKSGNKVTFGTFVNLTQKQKKQLVEFPVHCLPTEIKEYIEAVAESLQVPTDMVASLVLAVVALCVQGKFQIEIKRDWVESLNLYSIVVGCPSERKSPTLKEVEAPIFEYIEKENELRKPAIEEYRMKKSILDGQLKNIQDEIVKKGNKAKSTIQDALECKKKLNDLKEVHELQLVLDDVTPEALVEVMRRNDERVGIISAEGGMFGMMAGRYSNNTNIDIFLKGYSGEYYHSARMSRKETALKNPYLTILLAVQPQIIAEVMNNNEFRGRGLLARFLYSVPNSKVGSRTYRSEPVPEETRQKYKELIFELLKVPDMVGFVDRTITLSKEADKLSEEYNQWIEKRLLNELSEIEDWSGKMHGNTMRIAGILHVIKHQCNSVNIPLEEETMKTAIEIGMYYLEHAKNAFDIMGLSEPQDIRDARYILSRLEETDINDGKDNNRFISKRNVMRLCKRFKTAEDMQGGLDCLEEHGYISIVKESSGKGRPAENIYINPEYLKYKEKQ